MDYRQYFQHLVWERLIREDQFHQWWRNKDEKLKAEIEDKYKIFNLHINHSETDGFSWSLSPSPLRILSHAFADKIVFEIDLNKYNHSNDYDLLLEEIKDKLGFELNDRKGVEAHATDLNYRPGKNFKRDLEILSYWEELRNRPYKEIADRFGIGEDTARKALKRTYELIYQESFHRTKNKVKTNTDFPCDSCPPQQKARCQTSCEELEAYLDPITKKRDWRELLT